MKAATNHNVLENNDVGLADVIHFCDGKGWVNMWSTDQPKRQSLFYLIFPCFKLDVSISRTNRKRTCLFVQMVKIPEVHVFKI